MFEYPWHLGIYHNEGEGGGVPIILQPPVVMPQLTFTASVDDYYIAVGNNIDISLQEKIKVDGYVDFARLLPRDCNNADDHRMELINKGGQTYFVPIADREMSGINNFSKWE